MNESDTLAVINIPINVSSIEWLNGLPIEPMPAVDGDSATERQLGYYFRRSMPTIYRQDGYRFFFYSNENDEDLSLKGFLLADMKRRIGA